MKKEMYNIFDELQYKHCKNFLKELLKKDGILYKEKPIMNLQNYMKENISYNEQHVDSYINKDNYECDDEYLNIKLRWFNNGGDEPDTHDLIITLDFDKKTKISEIDDLRYFNYLNEEYTSIYDYLDEFNKELKSLLNYHLPLKIKTLK